MRSSLRPALVLPGYWSAGLELALAAAAGGLWYARGSWDTYEGRMPGPVTVPLALLGLMWALRLARSLPTSSGRAHLLPPAFTIPLALFLTSAWIGLHAAYDPGPALAKGGLVVGALGIYWATAGQADRSRIAGALGFWALFGAGLGAFFLLTHDWSALPMTLQWLQRLLQRMQSALPPSLAQDTVNPNVAAGVLIVVLPFYVPLYALLRRLRRSAAVPAMTQPSRRLRNRRPPSSIAAGLADGAGTVRPSWDRRVPPWLHVLLCGFGIGAALISAIAWLLAASRGAGPALGIATALWAVWRLSGRLPWRLRCAIVVGVALMAGLAAVNLGRALLGGWDIGPLTRAIGHDLSNRLGLAQLGASLARDVPFTGIGPGMFEMHLAIYTLHIHVGFVKHSHNMLVDMAIEQGALGAIAYGAMVVMAIVIGYRSLKAANDGMGTAGKARSSDQQSGGPPPEMLVESALVSLVAAFLHGLLDDPLYGSRAILFLFLPFGMLVAAVRLAAHHPPLQSVEPMAPARRRSSEPHLLSLAIAGVLAIGATAIYAQPWRGFLDVRARLAGAWYANRGAVAQARAELTVYDQHRFSELTIDQVRRQEDLTEALTLFGQAVQADPMGTTANQRLAAVALSRGDYENALHMMQRLWDAGARDRVTRLLYGDALVATGQWAEAVDIVQGLQFAGSRLAGQAWSRYHLAGDTLRESWATSAANRLGE